MAIPPTEKLVFVSMQEWVERGTTKSKRHEIPIEDHIEIQENGSVKIPSFIIDEMNWKVKTKLVLVEHDKELQQITLGKELRGEEAVNVMHKIADGFS